MYDDTKSELKYMFEKQRSIFEDLIQTTEAKTEALFDRLSEDQKDLLRLLDFLDKKGVFFKIDISVFEETVKNNWWNKKSPQEKRVVLAFKSSQIETQYIETEDVMMYRLDNKGVFARVSGTIFEEVSSDKFFEKLSDAVSGRLKANTFTQALMRKARTI